jgi:hypothetical protein
MNKGKGMSRVVAMSILEETGDAEIIVWAISTSNKLRLIEFLDA